MSTVEEVRALVKRLRATRVDYPAGLPQLAKRAPDYEPHEVERAAELLEQFAAEAEKR